MNDDWSISLLPHYRRQDDGVLFLVDPVPVLRLVEHELDVFDALGAGVTVAQLRALPAAALQLALRLCELGIAVACPAAPTVAGRHLLVVEPHMDDAVLSAGGQMLLRRGAQRVTVLSVARWSDYTKHSPGAAPSLDSAAVSALRLAESRLAGKLVGFDHETMDELDFPVRLRAEQRVDEGSDVSALRTAAKRFGPTPAEVAALSARIFARVEALAPDEIWMPLGVGENPDHVRTALACLQMLCTEERFFDGRSVSLYEDLAQFPAFAGHIERIVAVHARTGALRRIEENIGAVIADKVRAVSVYASQFDMAASAKPMSNMSALLRTSAMGSSGADPVELRYEVVRRPRLPAFSEIAFRPVELTAVKVALAPWVRRRLRVERVAVLSAGSFGKWDRGLEVLVHAFPNARFEVFTTEPYFRETGTASSPVVSARSVEERELRAVLARLIANNTLILIIGDPAALRGVDAAPRGLVTSSSFGDAVMALHELVTG